MNWSFPQPMFDVGQSIDVCRARSARTLRSWTPNGRPIALDRHRQARQCHSRPATSRGSLTCRLKRLRAKIRSGTAAADPGLRIELVGKLTHAKVVERRPRAHRSPPWSKTRLWHDCTYGTRQMTFRHRSVSRAPAKAHFHPPARRTEPGHLCGRAVQAERAARRAESAAARADTLFAGS